MPIYEYLCPECNFKFELLRQQSQATESVSCPRCHNGAKRIFSAFPCEVLDGWLMVSLWKGPEAVEHYNFCSLNCLKTWVDTQLPQVPDAFLRAFEKRED